MLRYALGVLLWSPDQFWRCSLNEYVLAMQGYSKSKGVDSEREMTRNELLDLIDHHKKNQRRVA